MSTLKELFDKHGSVWLGKRSTVTGQYIKYFKPLAYNSHNTRIVGEKYDGSGYSREIEDTGFTLWREKVKRYKYLILDKESGRPFETDFFFKDDQDALSNFDRDARFSIIMRIEESMREFDR